MKRLISLLFVSAMIGAVQPVVAGDTDLAGTAWLVDDIGGRGVVDRARTTLQFVEPGRIAGHTGCNRFFGSVDLDGDRITFGNLGVTRMACPESLMNQEHRFVEAMTHAGRLELAHRGMILIIFDDDGERVLELSRVIEK